MQIDDNVIIDELSKKKVSTWKRLFVFLFDSILIFGTFFALFFTAGSAAIKGIAKNNIAGLNKIYAAECDRRSVPYKESMYGVYQLDKDKYIEMILPTKANYEEAVEDYNNLFYEIDSSIQNYVGYSGYYEGFAGAYYGTLIVSLFVPSLIYLFIIPIITKKGKTIGMIIIKTSLAQDSTNVLCSPGRVAVRFFSAFAIEIALSYVVAQYIGIGFVGLINILLICFTKKKKTIHDFLTKCHVEKDEFTYTPDIEY